jgi:hypothetical protein
LDVDYMGPSTDENQQNWSKQVAKHYFHEIHLHTVFGIRKNCYRKGKNLLLHLKLTAAIVGLSMHKHDSFLKANRTRGRNYSTSSTWMSAECINCCLDLLHYSYTVELGYNVTKGTEYFVSL